MTWIGTAGHMEINTPFARLVVEREMAADTWYGAVFGRGQNSLCSRIECETIEDAQAWCVRRYKELLQVEIDSL